MGMVRIEIVGSFGPKQDWRALIDYERERVIAEQDARAKAREGR